MLVNLVEVAAP